ncbi:uroporphyrinogen-III synthase [Arhodomonas sp. AD133]|uniref:uroporphyrinogen-III synthase n=1 Tax=Arhodomonas sp. AD133 TaxID=3415009 RepID=UPI003EC09D3D
MTAALAGVGVVVTRPRAQGEGLARRLRELGAEVVSLPTIEIRPIADSATDAALREAFAHADWLIFVSPSAVDVTVARCRTLRLERPSSARVAAVGPGTARALTDAGWGVDVCPATGGGGVDLLEEPALAPLAGCHCVILTASGGRRVLPDGLLERGATVTELPVYERAQPDVDAGTAVAGWQCGRLQYTIVTSLTGLEHLFALVGADGRPALCASRLITVSPRIAERAVARGFRATPAVAARPGDEGLVEALQKAVQESTGSHA